MAKTFSEAVGPAILTLTPFPRLFFTHTQPLQQTHPALTSIFPPAAAAATVAVWAASALTVGVLGYCAYVFVAAAVIR